VILSVSVDVFGMRPAVAQRWQRPDQIRTIAKNDQTGQTITLERESRMNLCLF
jgi:hypothetical protein